MATKFATPSDIDNKTIVLNSDNKLEIAYTSNALIGPGRPDDPSTTNGVIKGTETDGMMYQSTDGAGVGAFLWLHNQWCGQWTSRSQPNCHNRRQLCV